MLDPRTLEIFYWVVQLGGFRRAAGKLHTTQPAVSARIAALEASLGVRLLERDRRRVTLTPKGMELLGYAERLLALQAEVQAAMAERSLVRGTVRLGLSETLVHTWLSVLIRRLHEVYPLVTLDIGVDVSVSLRDSLLAGELDVALLLGPVAAAKVRSLPLCDYGLVWVARPDLPVGEGTLPLAALARWPLLTYARSTRPYKELAELVGRHGLAPARIFANTSIASIVRMALDGIGIGVLAHAAVEREVTEGRLRLLRVEPELAPLSFTACWIDGPGSALPAAVAGLAQQVARLR